MKDILARDIKKEKIVIFSKLKNITSRFSTGKNLSHLQRKNIYLSHLNKKYGKDIT